MRPQRPRELAFEPPRRELAVPELDLDLRDFRERDVSPAEPRTPSLASDAGPPRESLVDIVADLPMGISKRLAVYPLVAWWLGATFVPCRMTARLCGELLVVAVIGVLAAWARLRRHGLD